MAGISHVKVLEKRAYFSVLDITNWHLQLVVLCPRFIIGIVVLVLRCVFGGRTYAHKVEEERSFKNITYPLCSTLIQFNS